ncbi:MAG: FecR domain-containing protein [Chitinophagaceae bacterium]|nr:FecR domain-containing protein [Chitinophagaceae bacterium]
MNEAQFIVLLDKYVNDSLSPDELSLFISYLREYKHTGHLEELIERAFHDDSFMALSDQSKTESIFRKILQQAKSIEAQPGTGGAFIQSGGSNNRTRILRWLAAASLLAGIASLSYFVFIRQKKNETPVSIVKKAPATDAEPGGNRAVLKLANGKELVLDSAGTGMLALQGGSTILKTEEGRLAYNVTAGSSAEPVYNTLSTPRGGQYQLTLPDGSKVWLNAASSLRFPVAFSGGERVVELAGEAYFEIASSKTPDGGKQRFIVRDGNPNAGENAWQVEVLGTHFNIMAYNNEQSVQTSLLEGAVAFSASAQTVKIKPDQQAVMNNSSRNIQVRNAAVLNAVAWKDGLFRFSSDDVQYIMRQLERWYDVNVIYAGKVPPGHYSGIVNRNSKLSTVLKILEESGLDFIIQDKTLTVFPQ